MRALDVIADDVTGACDVGAELAHVGFAVRVALDPTTPDGDAGDIRVVNTQSRAVRASEAYARVLRIVRRRPGDLLLKKIDTALRGHLGAELDAAVDGLCAAAAFVVPAIPAAGRVTRGGCQWFGGRRLSETEFASDPEGSGGEASVAAVIARESRRRSEVIGLDVVRAGALPERARTLMRAGVDVFVVDAETDADLDAAARGILDLPRPLCVVGSIGIAAAVAATLAPRHLRPRAGTPPPMSTEVGLVSETHRFGGAPPGALPAPALIVSGSLHSMARAQLAALVDAGHAERVALSFDGAASAGARATAVAQARASLAAGRSVIMAAPATEATPDLESRRFVERVLAAATRDVVRTRVVRALVLIGGETGHAVLRDLGATEVVVGGRLAPLVATGTIVGGDGDGLPLVIKGGSGGQQDSVRALLAGDGAARCATG